MQQTERRAVLTLIALAVAGHGARIVLTDPGEAPGGTLLPPAGRAALIAHRDRVAEVVRPLEKGERVDLDQAQLADLVRLPRVGPSLAKAIIADRQRHGPFGRLEELARVSGVGPVLLEAVRPHAAFSGTATATREPDNAGAGLAPPMVDINRATASELQRLPGIGPTRAAELVAYREVHGPFATLESLAAVPGIGERLVARLRGQAQVR